MPVRVENFSQRIDGVDYCLFILLFGCLLGPIGPNNADDANDMRSWLHQNTNVHRNNTPLMRLISSTRSACNSFSYGDARVM